MRKILSNIALSLFFAMFALSLGAIFIYNNTTQGAIFNLVGMALFIIHLIIKPRD